MCYFDEYPEETELITFGKMESRGITGRADDGIIVFVDSYSKVEVKLGETWICRLLRGRGLSQYYLAWPIEKIERKQPVEEVSEEISIEDGSFVALGNDRIFSKKLREGHYTAYRSLNGSWLQLIPSENGNIGCRDNSIAIEGLDGFMSGLFPRTLEYSCREDCFLIKLEE
ncbi:hypothetical protein [Methanomethylophilus alvi]|uniref:hypothetical protein n=1 Tax=Methanomethylophilus alvi TaxID=1291540 RepID=UPI0037DD67C3